MSHSTDPGHFFQTDASDATRARRAAKSGNKNGNPIKLQSKILSLIADPFSEDCVYVAESAGCIRRVNFKTRDTKTVYRGPTAPLTSVAIGGSGNNTVFAGCWDKDIWSWDRETQVFSRRYKGHSDFVKSIISVKLSGRDCILSGSADSKIILWDTATGTKLHTLRDPSSTMRAIQFLALDPITTTPTELTLLSSHSDPKIRRWRISLSSWSLITDEAPSVSSSTSALPPPKDAILEHETSVYALHFDSTDPSSDDSDLWTASADGTAKCLSRAKNWAAEETLAHGDYVRAVVVTADWVVTAGRDEDVKVWDRNSGKLWHVYEGHFEEITGLLIVDGGRKAVSVGIDGTVRVWGLGRADLEKARVEKEEKEKGVVKEEAKAVPKKSLMTAEEEAELADLMDSDE